MQLLEAEIRASGRNRVLLNRHPLQRTRDLLGLLRVTVFAPDDLQLVKGGPAGRRDYLDDLLVAISPRYEAARADYERVLRQRNALLRGGVRGDDDAEHARRVRRAAGARPAPSSSGVACGCSSGWCRRSPTAYDELAGGRTPITAAYEAEWAAQAATADSTSPARRGAARRARGARRKAELERGITLVGPHRDEWRLRVGGLDSRTHASQGEQRTLALALRLGGHRLVRRADRRPRRCCCSTTCSASSTTSARVALVAHLDAAQTLVTTAGAVPRGIARRPHAARRRRPGGGAGVSASEPGTRRVATPTVPAWRRGRRYRATSRCRCPTTLARSARSSGSPPATCTARSTRAGSTSSAPTSRRTRGSCRCATACSRSRSTTRIWATQLRYLEAAVVERATGLVGPGAVTLGAGARAASSRANPAETPAKSAGTPPNPAGPSGTAEAIGYSVL